VLKREGRSGPEDRRAHAWQERKAQEASNDEGRHGHRKEGLDEGILDQETMKVYTADEVSIMAMDAANIAVAAWLDPGRWCERAEGEGLGDWSSRAKTIAIHEFIKKRNISSK